MWKLNLPRKVKVFVWQACSGSLPTADRLRSRRVECQTQCSLCQSAEETTTHLFIDCRFAKECWDLIGLPVLTNATSSFELWVDILVTMLDKDQCRLLFLICWKIWLARNDKIWNNKNTSSRCLVEGTKYFLADWNSAWEQDSSNPCISLPVIHKWEKPRLGNLKLNTDAAVNITHNRVGFGWVLRDHSGQFLAASSIPGVGVSSPKEAEALAIREALSWIKRMDLHKVQVECDALQIVHNLNRDQDVSSCDLVLLDIKDMLRSLTDVAISYVNRTANSVAHNLANTTRKMHINNG